MTAEHLLNAIGLLDDKLIQESERYAAPKRRRNYGTWAAWAASFAVMLVLSYGLTHLNIGMGGGSANGGGNTQAAGSTGGGIGMNGGSAPSSSVPPGGASGGNDFPAQEPAAPNEPAGSAGGAENDRLAVVIEGVVYRSTGETVPLFPDGDDIRYDISWYDVEDVEYGETGSGQGLCYLMLEDGTAAVSWQFQSRGWLIFAPDPDAEP